MLTVEEQIERIADHALERASAPLPAPRRWPAMAAAALLLVATGSMVWVATGREPDHVSGVVPSSSDPLTARLQGAEEYRLSPVALGNDVENTGVVLEEPGTIAAVQTVDRVTVFRVSGLNTAPGSAVYAGRCAGIPEMSIACDVPAFSGLAWITGTPHLPEFDRLSIWVDVPAETAVVLITDGSTKRWQHPVDGLAVWPAATTTGWTVEAIDDTGSTITTVNESTVKQLRAAASEGFDTQGTTPANAEAVERVRNCLVSGGAKFGANRARPHVREDVDATALWGACTRELTETVTGAVAVAPPFASALDLGVTGDQVLLLEQQLSDLGLFVGAIDDRFDADTERAVWAWKKRIGGTTWQELDADPFKTTVDEETWAATTMIQPRRPGRASRHHVEVDLPLQGLGGLPGPRSAVDRAPFVGTTGRDRHPATFCEPVFADTDFDGQPIDPPEQRTVCGESVTPGAPLP